MEKRFAERLAKLRIQKGVSARQMSIALLQNESYINNIENGRGLPSLSAFFSICDYFEIQPQEFFDTATANPQALSELMNDIKSLNEEQIELLKGFVKQMK